MPSSGDQPRTPRSKRRRVRIEREGHAAGVDHRKLGRALLRLAQAEYEREHGTAEADSEPPQQPPTEVSP